MRDEDLWGWGPVTQRSVRTGRVVEAPPTFRIDACVSDCVQDLAIEKFVTDAGVETLDIPILLRVL